MSLPHPTNQIAASNLTSLRPMCQSFHGKFSKRFKGFISWSDLGDFLYDLAVDVSLIYNPSLGCKITTLYYQWVTCRVNDLLTRNGCGKCECCCGSGIIIDEPCLNCHHGLVRLFIYTSAFDPAESEPTITMGEWLATMLSEDDVPPSFVQLQSADFNQFAKELKEILSASQRILVSRAFLGRPLDEADRSKLRRLKQTMTDGAINTARHRGLKKFTDLLHKHAIANGLAQTHLEPKELIHVQ